MNTRTVGLSRFAAAACAAAITAVSAWAFVSSSGSSERDPFQFAAVMAANAKVRVAQLQTRGTSTCRNQSETDGQAASPACLKG